MFPRKPKQIHPLPYYQGRTARAAIDAAWPSPTPK